MKRPKIVSLLVACLIFFLMTAYPLTAFGYERISAKIQDANQNKIERLYGGTRFQTMLEIALKFNPGAAKSVVLASGNNFPDALAGVSLAKQKNAPLLLVDRTPDTSSEAFSYITNHLDKDGDIYILGGMAVIPDTFVTALQNLGYHAAKIHRLAGNDRYETSIAIAKEIQNDGTEYYIATGDSFPDALSASVLAATTKTMPEAKSAYLKTKGLDVPPAAGGVPLLLVPSEGPIPDSIINYLNSFPDQGGSLKQSFHIVGGSAVVPEASLEQLRTQVKRLKADGINRIAGTDRYEIMKKINTGNFDASWQNNGKGLAVPHIYLATGENYPDALTGAVLAAKDCAPLILINESMPDATVNLLSGFHDQNTRGIKNGTVITVLGGTGIISTRTVAAVDSFFNLGQSLAGKDQLWTFAGSGVLGYQDGQSQDAMFAFPSNIIEGNNGKIFVSDSKNQCIRVIQGGTVTTLAGVTKEKDKYGMPVGGYVDGAPGTAMFNEPKGLALDENGNLYVADFGNGAIRIVDQNGNVRTLLKGLNSPSGVAIGKDGSIYVTETLNHRILKVSLSGEWSVLAGGGYEKKDGSTIGGYADGKGEAAKFNEPSGLALGPNGLLYVADTGNQRIRAVAPDGTVTTVAGSGTELISGTTYLTGGFADGPGTEAQFNFPSGLTVAADQTIYVADTYNQRIRRITPDGTVKTFAGNGQPGKQNGLLSQAGFDGPSDLVIQKNGDLLIVDQWNHLIRIVQRTSTTSQ